VLLLSAIPLCVFAFVGVVFGRYYFVILSTSEGSPTGDMNAGQVWRRLISWIRFFTSFRMKGFSDKINLPNTHGDNSNNGEGNSALVYKMKILQLSYNKKGAPLSTPFHLCFFVHPNNMCYRRALQLCLNALAVAYRLVQVRCDYQRYD
jgi:hypothetical protein